jgi:hypothetical protein
MNAIKTMTIIAIFVELLLSEVRISCGTGAHPRNLGKKLFEIKY